MKKSLQTKILVAIALAIIGFWVISGVLARRHASSFLAEHQDQLQQQGQRQQPLSEPQQKQLYRQLAVIRFVMAAVAVISISIVFGVMWRRRVSRPMAQLSERMRQMRLGTWNHSIPLDQTDEMGTLVREFNQLGPELTFTAHQYAAASKLAAMALIGQRVVRGTTTARQRLLALSEALSHLPADETLRGIAIEQIKQVASELETVAAAFDSEFQAELARVSSTPGTTGGNKAA
jgi:nitrogen fixation/metabolism regulation signal transduction histidine kinase